MELQLQKLRKAAGLSQQDMADALGVKKRTYGSWERGEVTMSFPQAIACARILGCTTDAIAGLENERFADSSQSQLNNYFQSMDDAGKAAITETARLMSGNSSLSE